MTHEEIQELAGLNAIGAASADEVEKLRQHLATCADCRKAADEMNEAAAMIALSVDPVAPPPHVRDAVLRSVRKPAASRSVWWAAAAAILLVVAGWNMLRVQGERERERRLQEQIAKLQADRDQLSATISALTSGTTRTIALAGQSVAPSASARVFLDAPHRRAFVFFQGLPANPQDKSYQLWVIRADQVAPMSAGVFGVDASGSASLVVQNLPIETNIKALAVTLEPKGGVAAPTGQKYLVGM